ncbi:MAG: YdbH domain-containing protein [Candidatus Aminicenantes bacterium]|nr:YdbH domain-containing protein [Candidatus Aminicenantes bacterium]
MPAKKTVWRIIIGLAGAAVLYLYLSLPGITKNVLAAQAEKFGLKNLQFSAIHVGWRRLDLADVTLGDAAAPALRIPYLSVEYSLAGLWQKKIRNVRLVGASIKIEDRGQGFQFQGMTAPLEPQSGEMVSIERLSLEDGNLKLAWGGRSLEIPFEATLRASRPGYSFAALLRPLAETVRLQGTVDKNLTAGKITWEIPGFPLQTLIDQAGFGTAAWGQGRIAAKGQMILKDGKFKTASFSVSGPNDLRLALPDQASLWLDSFTLAFHLDSGFKARDIVAAIRGRRLRFGELAVESPFNLDIRGRLWPDLEFSGRDLQVALPLPLVFERITAKVTGTWAAAQFKGDFRLQTGNRMLAALGLPGEISKPYAIGGDFQCSLKEGMISWTLRARGNQGIVLTLGRDSLRGRLDLNAILNGDTQRLHASAACRMPDANLQLAGYHARAEVFSGNAELEYGFGGNISGRGRVELNGGKVNSNKSTGLEAAGISLNMPWQWPGSGPGLEGGFSVARLQSNGMGWQNISGILVQNDAALRFSGSMHSILAKIAVKFQGDVAPDPGGSNLQTTFSIPPVVLQPRTSLHPLLQGISGGGSFQAEGRIWARNDAAGGNAIMKIADADFEQKEERIAVRGVNGSITLERLFDFITAPAQRIVFRELKWQDKSFSNGELVFAGESGGTIFIESGRFDWCQGKIIIAPFRIEPGKTDFLMTIYCDRVNFAQMLNALLGKAVISGDAEMNGMIPVRMVNGSPVFLDGYLYSTPGSSGNLRVSQPELISGGQVLVEEAIRDFRYNWIKVKMSSRGDRLDMIVSIDGAPAQKLPLRYDAKKKDFIRDPTGGRHVQLKGLLLDIRFLDIDLKDLLKAGSQMSAGQRKIK